MKKHIFIIFFILLTFSVICTAADMTVLLERVRYCNNFTCLTGGTTPWKFHYWNDNNVGTGDQRKTYIATLSQPSAGNVQSLAVFFAGQQAMDFGNWAGKANVVTGQKEDYKKDCRFQHKSCNRPATEDSLAVKVYRSGVFDLNKTFFALVYDTAFFYGTGSGNKEDIEDAYYDWLLDKFNNSNLKTVYLAGSSRGGCLALRLAKRFKQDFPSGHTRVIVSVLDPVCNKGQGEMGTTNTEQQNPHTSWTKYHGWYSNLNSQYPNKDGLSIYNILAGERVVPLSSSHALSYGTEVHKEICWYRHDWIYEEHTVIGREPSTTLHNSSTKLINAQLAFVKEKVTGNGFAVGDFDGNGKDEFFHVAEFMSLKQYSGSTWQEIWSNDGTQSGIAPYRELVVGDFDGDGKDEVMGISATWMTMFHYENGAWQWGWSNYGNQSIAISPYKTLIPGDFDGDGKDEVMGIGTTWMTMFHFENGSWQWGWSNGGDLSLGISPYKNLIAGDFDGDGKDEVMGIGGWMTMFHYENGSWQWGWSNYGNQSLGISPYKNLIPGDFDGDGKDELMGVDGWTTMFHYENNTWNWGWSNYGSGTQAITPYKELVPGNFDSDTKCELVGISQSYPVFHYGSGWSVNTRVRR
ncbi:MAG: VCBS repeat-containing protein [bacterium]|nr:VCBS repeat-containing protein [bacterium]